MKINTKNSKFDLPIKLKRSYVIFLCAFSLIVYLISLVFPYIFRYVLDNVGKIKTEKLYLYIIGIILFASFSHGLSYLCDYLNQIFCNKTVLNYQKEIVKKISKINTPDYEGMNKAKILNLLNYDVAVVYTYLSLKIELVVDSIKIFVVSLILLKINYILAGITFVLVPIYYLGNYLNKNKMEKLANEEVLLGDKSFEQAQDVVLKKTSIELFKAWKLFFKKYNYISEEFWKVRGTKHKFLILNMEFPKFISTLSPFIVLILGASFVHRGIFTIGTLIMFLQYAQMIYTPITSIANLKANANSSVASFERIRNFLNYENEENNYSKLFVKQENPIEVKNVEITNANDELLFKIEDFTISKNGLYILKGDNGTGKTTLLNLLAGVYSVNQIKEKCGYFRIAENQKEEISYLYNPAMLFNGSVRENIILSETESEEELSKMRNLLKRFNAKDENYEVKTNSANLSLGESQKLFLIRTFMQGKNIVLLDEPSANLDVDSKVILRDFLKEEKENSIIILIAHDLLYEEISDEIYVVMDKKLVKK
ncbi:ABC transporter ATP-binding protein [uncultured Parvimonas sp.]|uniref:ABC transporter ATP-binding protein n=1 Tax=uncultured Parvimonas sp. TaxID=747372 RepID=UPI00288BDC9C|nr:ABC transporter ATP-binding protein [uncultured Parvimonas sp.]